MFVFNYPTVYNMIPRLYTMPCLQSIVLDVLRTDCAIQYCLYCASDKFFNQSQFVLIFVRQKWPIRIFSRNLKKGPTYPVSATCFDTAGNLVIYNYIQVQL